MTNNSIEKKVSYNSSDCRARPLTAVPHHAKNNNLERAKIAYMKNEQTVPPTVRDYREEE